MEAKAMFSHRQIKNDKSGNDNTQPGTNVFIHLQNNINDQMKNELKQLRQNKLIVGECTV